MENDLTFALQQLMRSYDFQIEYLRLLVSRGLLHADGAGEEIVLLQGKIDRAAERLVQLCLGAAQEPAAGDWAIDPALIPDLQYILS